MKAFTKAAGTVATALLAAATGTLFQTAPAAAATPTLPSLVAYVRSGNVYVSKGATEKRLTTDGGYSRPSFSPDGTRLALLKGGQLWTMKADGSAKRRLTTRAAAGASWSPDGRWLAFASLGCTGGPVVYRVSATTVGAAPQVLFPSECRDQEVPAEAPITNAQAGTLSDRLRYDDAVAWSPDGSKIAFRGGQCESVYDSCLSIGTVATGGERTVAAYGGGSRQNSGFAVLPNFSRDGAKLAFTAYQEGETVADDQPIHLEEYNQATGTKRTVGAAQDRELAYLDANKGVATGQYRGSSWVMVVNLNTGAHTAFHAGSQPTVQPVR